MHAYKYLYKSHPLADPQKTKKDHSIKRHPFEINKQLTKTRSCNSKQDYHAGTLKISLCKSEFNNIQLKATKLQKPKILNKLAHCQT